MIKFDISENSEKAVYIQLKDSIKKAIISGKYPPLSKLPPVSKISAASGVSLRTADIALQELINEGVCFRRPKKGTFVSDIQKYRKQQICGIIASTSPVANPLRALLYCGVMESAARNSIPAFMIPVPDTEKSETPADVIRRFDDGMDFDMKGVFVITQFYNNEAIEIARQFPQKRFFFLNYQGEWLKNLPENAAAVVNDDFAGAYYLAQYVFTEYKIRNAAILSVPLTNGDLTYIERISGFKKAAKEANIKINTGIKINKHANSFSGQINSAYEAVKLFLANGGETDFIFCVNDLFAQGAKNAIEECGLKGKIHVSGYDCIHELPNYDIPSVKVAYTEMGKIALQKMLADSNPMQTVTKLLPEIIKP